MNQNQTAWTHYLKHSVSTSQQTHCVCISNTKRSGHVQAHGNVNVTGTYGYRCASKGQYNYTSERPQTGCSHISRHTFSTIPPFLWRGEGARYGALRDFDRWEKKQPIETRTDWEEQHEHYWPMREVPWRGGAWNVTERSAPTWKMSQLAGYGCCLVLRVDLCGRPSWSVARTGEHAGQRAVLRSFWMDLLTGKANKRILKTVSRSECPALPVLAVNTALCTHTVHLLYGTESFLRS